jgi:hypothetical protein
MTLSYPQIAFACSVNGVVLGERVIFVGGAATAFVPTLSSGQLLCEPLVT